MPELPDSHPLRGDPLHGVRVIRWRTRLIVYSLIAVIVPMDHFIIGTPWLTTIAMTMGGGYAIATAGIEFSFFYFSKLRKQAAYPAVLAMELGATDDFGCACERSVRLVAELLGADKVILAWSDHHQGGLITVATHGIPSEDTPLTTPLPWCQPAVRRAIGGRKVVVASAREGRAWLSPSDGRGRVVHVPLLSLEKFVGLLTLAGKRRTSDLGDKTLLSAIGLTMGLTLDNLHHTVDLREMATRDELTQLFNRRYFFEQLERELKAARRSERPVGLLILDVDSLKLINDTYGHSVGDKVLEGLGKLLAKKAGPEDIPARIGGDEFAVLMRDSDKQRALAAAARLEKALQARPMYKGRGIELRLSVSCGVAGYPWSGESATEVMHWADANMYEVKAQRKGQAEAKEELPVQSSC
jgi:diguanylate cyclase (GGDEF)-like protein